MTFRTLGVFALAITFLFGCEDEPSGTMSTDMGMASDAAMGGAGGAGGGNMMGGTGGGDTMGGAGGGDTMGGAGGGDAMGGAGGGDAMGGAGGMGGSGATGGMGGAGGDVMGGAGGTAMGCGNGIVDFYDGEECDDGTDDCVDCLVVATEVTEPGQYAGNILRTALRAFAWF